MIVLETERMSLRRLTMDDVDNMLGIYSDPVAMEHFPSTRDRDGTIEYLERTLARYEEDGHGFWACIRKSDGEYLGNCGVLKQEVEGEFELEVGYQFLRKHWGKGYATEAAIACRDYAFEHLGADPVISMIAPANEPSQRVAQRNGMTPGRMINKWGLDLVVHAITRAEWEALKSATAS